LSFLRLILPWTILALAPVLALAATSRRAQSQIPNIRNLLVVFGAFWLSLWTVNPLSFIFGKINNRIIYSNSDNVLSMVAMGVMTSMGRTVAAILAGVIVVGSADSEKPELWASIVAVLYVVDAPVHYFPWRAQQSVWDQLWKGVDFLFPAIACILVSVAFARFRPSKAKS
jgi:hypothetical protein